MTKIKVNIAKVICKVLSLEIIYMPIMYFYQLGRRQPFLYMIKTQSFKLLEESM